MRTIRKRKQRGFSIIEMMIVVLIIANLMMIALPQFIQARANSRLSAILMNLKTIEQAKSQCVMEKGLQTGETTGCKKGNLVNPNNGYMTGVWPKDEPIIGGYNPQAVGIQPTFRGKDAEWWRANPAHPLLK